MPNSPGRKKVRRKEDTGLGVDRRAIVRKPKANSWFNFTRQPWFKQVKNFLLADSFAYGPFLHGAPPHSSNMLTGLQMILEKTVGQMPNQALKGTFWRDEQELDALGSAEEERRKKSVFDFGAVGTPLPIQMEGSSGTERELGNALSSGWEAGGESVVQTPKADGNGGRLVHVTIQKRVITATTTLNSNEHQATPSTPSPFSPSKELDATLDTEVTDTEELEEDEGESRAEDEFVPLDIESAVQVAKGLIEKLGGRFSEEFGIHVDDGDDEVERWFIAANLFSRAVPVEVSLQTFKELGALGVASVCDFLKVEEVKLIEIFENTGYSKHGARVASLFIKMANQVQEKLWGRVTKLKHLTDSTELVRRLRSLSGVKLSAARIFVRELRGVWQACDLEFETKTKKAAVHLKLLSSVKPPATFGPKDILFAFAREAGIDGRDLEVALAKLGAVHEKQYRDCPGGPECGAAGNGPA